MRSLCHITIFLNQLSRKGQFIIQTTRKNRGILSLHPHATYFILRLYRNINKCIKVMPIYNHLESISCRMTQLFVLQAHHYSYTPTIAIVNKGMTGMMYYSHNDIPTSFKLCMNKKNHNTKLIVFTERSKCKQQAKGQKSPRQLSRYNRD